jgi:glycosyltransferase involved in cell wall biosynthesis
VAATRDRLAVAVEVSALGHGDHDERAFVEFVLAALANDESASTSPWSLRRLARPDRHRAGKPSRRGWLAGRTSLLGVAPSARWAAPRAHLRFLASGPARLRVDPPGVITVRSVAEVLRIDAAGGTPRSIAAQLRRSTDRGVIVHATCHAAADAAVSVLGLDRTAVVVAYPGLAVAAVPDSAPVDAIGVVAGSDGALAHATLDLLRARGVAAELVVDGAASARRCVVFASPGDGFPFRALEAMARDTPVITARTTSTSEVLEGAVVMLDAPVARDLAEAAVTLAANDAHRLLAIAAGRARAHDFGAQQRAPELVSLLRSALWSR